MLGWLDELAALLVQSQTLNAERMVFLSNLCVECLSVVVVSTFSAFVLLLQLVGYFLALFEQYSLVLLLPLLTGFVLHFLELYKVLRHLNLHVLLDHGHGRRTFLLVQRLGGRSLMGHVHVALDVLWKLRWPASTCLVDTLP